MIHELKYTLLSDGSSDKVLLPIITWLLRQYLPDIALQPTWADLGHIRLPPAPKLWMKIQHAIFAYPCDLLFIHRDAENAHPSERINEINKNLSRLTQAIPPVICVIPIRMQEAWLLFDKYEIKLAAGNPNSNQDLSQIPRLNEVETLPNPKELLHDALRNASGLKGRRKKDFNPRKAVHRLADSIEDFSSLRQLSAFNDFEHSLQQIMIEQRWIINE